MQRRGGGGGGGTHRGHAASGGYQLSGYRSLHGDILSLCPQKTPGGGSELSAYQMATLPRRKSAGGGIAGTGGTTPRGSRGTHGTSFGRDHGSARGGAGVPPPPPNAWGRIPTERISAAPAPPAKCSAVAGVALADGYKVACRDRWINVTKTMMGEKAEIVTMSGCTYEGVFHVLTPVDPMPGQQGRNNGGMYQV